MNKELLEQLRYPIGKVKLPTPLIAEQRQAHFQTLRETPGRLRELVQSLDDDQLDTPYRPEGWTIRQVIHHLVDSHVNSYVRFRWTLTEDKPLIKVYDEKAWATLPDAQYGPVDISLSLLESLHIRWLFLLESMNESDWGRVLQHPVSGALTLDQMLGLYAWHCDHHLAHIAGLLDRKNWL